LAYEFSIKSRSASMTDFDFNALAAASKYMILFMLCFLLLFLTIIIHFGRISTTKGEKNGSTARERCELYKYDW